MRTDTPPQTHLLPSGEHVPTAVPVTLSTKPVRDQNAVSAAFHHELRRLRAPPDGGMRRLRGLLHR